MNAYNPSMTQYTLLDSPVEVVGAFGYDHDQPDRPDWVIPRRLPDWTRAQYADNGINQTARTPSGVRLRFRTSASEIKLNVLVSRVVITGLVETKRPAAFDLFVDGQEAQSVLAQNGNTLRLELSLPNVAVLKETIEPGADDLIVFGNLGDEIKDIEIWFPSSAVVEVGPIETNKEILAPNKDTNKKWVHYGSSISQCGEAERPFHIWPVRASKLLGLNLTNFGFGGQCQLDGFVARSIANTPADFISLKLGINLVNADSMRERAFIPAVHNLLDTIREKQPNVPILVISPIWCPFHETTSGPTLLGDSGLYSTQRPNELSAGVLTLTRIREILPEIIKKREDKNLHFMSGLDLFDKEDVHNMPDLLHPNSAGYCEMAERFVKAQKAFISAL
jgi:lysophospholipase L1-like esterase